MLAAMRRRTEIKIDPDVLIAEVGRYLAAVQAFRAEGCEPSWLPERRVPDVEVPRRRPSTVPRLGAR
jgi:hypothetical protein